MSIEYQDRYDMLYGRIVESGVATDDELEDVRTVLIEIQEWVDEHNDGVAPSCASPCIREQLMALRLMTLEARFPVSSILRVMP